METQAPADLTIQEAAILAGVSKRRIEKDCEEGIVPKKSMRLWLRTSNAAHVPAHAVAYARAMNAIVGVKMEKKTKRLVWKRLRDKAGARFGIFELSPGLSLDLDPLVSDAWTRTRTYLDARRRHLDADPGIFGGEPIIKGTRITCRSVLGRIVGGETLDDLVADYPEIDKDAFEVALDYARMSPPRGRPSADKPWRNAS